MVSLYSLLPASARLMLGPAGKPGAQANSPPGETRDNGAEQTKEVPADAIAKGDVIRVIPGDRLPVDGTVVSGRTTVDESALTGEPMPVTKEAGDAVSAGTVNVDGARLLLLCTPLCTPQVLSCLSSTLRSTKRTLCRTV